MALSVLEIPQLQRIGEAFAKTRPRYIASYLAVPVLAYAGMFLIDALGAPIPDTFVTAVGFAMMLLVAAGAIAIQAALAADAALDIPVSLPQAFGNYTRAIPLALALLLGALLLLFGIRLGGPMGLLITGAIVLWIAPMMVMFLGDAAEPPHRAVLSAIAHCVRGAAHTLPTLLVSTVLLWLAWEVGLLLLLYVAPYISMLGALTYRDLHGIDRG